MSRGREGISRNEAAARIVRLIERLGFQPSGRNSKVDGEDEI